jgi:hypothetical protein
MNYFLIPKHYGTSKEAKNHICWSQILNLMPDLMMNLEAQQKSWDVEIKKIRHKSTIGLAYRRKRFLLSSAESKKKQ